MKKKPDKRGRECESQSELSIIAQQNIHAILTPGFVFNDNRQ